MQEKPSSIKQDSAQKVKKSEGVCFWVRKKLKTDTAKRGEIFTQSVGIERIHFFRHLVLEGEGSFLPYLEASVEEDPAVGRRTYYSIPQNPAGTLAGDPES